MSPLSSEDDVVVVLRSDVDLGDIPALAETFHAVTLKRKFPNPYLPKLLRRIDDGLLPRADD
ncbi:MAG: hypothetical protein AAFN07_17415 [Pseudomonadota bacterium]